MSKIVVVHHALHADEGVYRLVYATESQISEPTVTQNPDFDPEAEVTEENVPLVHGEEIVTVHSDHREIVWDAGDPKWADRDPRDIAAEQRRIVSEAITKQVAAAERAAADRAQAQTHLGGVGTEL